jgi:excisionase family DNA binding protein
VPDRPSSTGWISTTQARRILRCSRNAVYKHIRDGKLYAVRAGAHNYRVREADVHAMAAQAQPEAAADA